MNEGKNWVLIVLIAIVLLYTFPNVFKKREEFSMFSPFPGFLGLTPTVKQEVRDITNNSIFNDNSIRQNIEQSCVNTTSTDNTLNIIGSKIKGLNTNQQNLVRNICALQSSFSNNVSEESQNKMAATIAQYAESKGGLLGASPSTDTYTILDTDNSKYINNSQVLNSVKKCINDISLNNTINIISSNVEDSNLNQTSDSFMECLASNEATIEIASKSSNDILRDIETGISAKGGDYEISSIVAVISSLFFLIGVLVFAYKVLNSPVGDKLIDKAG